MRQCAARRVNTAPPRSADSPLAVDTYRQFVTLGDPATHPAHDPPVWLWFFNAGYNVLAPFWQSTAQEGQPASLDLDTRDGFYANLNAGWPWSRVGPPRVRPRSESP